MATITITTTAAQDAAAQRYVNEFNAARAVPGYVPVTVLQWAKAWLTDKLDQLVAQYAERDRITKAEAVRAKPRTPTRPPWTAILAKYQ
jgi:hypothetical protein